MLLFLIVMPETESFHFRSLDVSSLAARGRENLGCCSLCPLRENIGRVYRAPLGFKNGQLRCEDRPRVRSLTLGTMNGKSTNGSLGGMACIEGLPPLPKSLSGLLNSSGGSWREMERMYVKKTMIQDDLSRGRNNGDNLLAHKPANLDAALALLRKEMVKRSSVAGDKRGFRFPALFDTTIGTVAAAKLYRNSGSFMSHGL